MRRNDIALFFKNLAIFIALLFICDYLLGLAMARLYFGQEKGQFAQTTYAIDSSAADIVVFGSSRATRHYSPAIFSSAFGLSCYNAGRDAEMIPYYAAVQEVILNRHKPKIIILDVNTWEVNEGRGKYEKLSVLLPYCQKHPELDKYIKEISPWEPEKLISRTYPYNSTLFISLNNYLLANRLPKDDNGYLPLDHNIGKKQFDSEIANIEREKLKERGNRTDERSLYYYRQFLETTERNNIRTYVVISPTISKEPDSKQKRLLVSIAATYKNVHFLDFSPDPGFNYRYELFADQFHLNKKGSEMFSRKLAKMLLR